MKKMVLASNNKHKIKEFKSVLNDVEIITMGELGYTEDIVEDGSTALENALLKARAVHDYLVQKGYEYSVLADDSGLCVNSLNGEPGIHSARYAADHNDAANRAKLQENLKDKEDRSAYFSCMIVLFNFDGSYESFEGRTEGVISKEEKGDKSFGYDCIFYSNDLNKTFGEATDDEKNSVSHRGRALKKLLEYMNK